jgi:hypothetical protein
MTTVHTILQINPCVFYKINLESIFYGNFYLYTQKVKNLYDSVQTP